LSIVPNLAFLSHMLHGMWNDNWQVFKDATLFFLHSTPNLATVILAMDHIDEMLTMSLLNNMYLPLIHATLSIAKQILNHYYNTTAHSEVYQIAIGEYIYTFFCQVLIIYNVIVVLHPWHKLKYFKHASWKPKWIAAVKDITWAEFDCSYVIQPVNIKEDQDENVEISKVHSSNIFNNLPALFILRTRELHNKLDRYLSTNPKHVVDVLMWWIERKLIYPHLSCTLEKCHFT